MQEQTNNPQTVDDSPRPESPNTVQNSSTDTQGQQGSDQYLKNEYKGQIEVSSPAIESNNYTTVKPDSMVAIFLGVAFLVAIIILLFANSKKSSVTKSVPESSKTESAPKTGTSASKSTSTKKPKKQSSKKRTSSKKKSTTKKKKS